MKVLQGTVDVDALKLPSDTLAVDLYNDLLMALRDTAESLGLSFSVPVLYYCFLISLMEVSWESK